MTRKRDLVGYGRNRPDILWPNGARVAISLALNFEEGAELSVEQGDPENERFGEVPSVQPPGVRDFIQEQVFEFGSRVGVWRFLDALERHRMRSAVLMCGQAVERSPELGRAIVEAGHEPMVHGWRWLAHSLYTDRESERHDIIRTRDVIAEVTGVMPVGFSTRGSQSPWTRDILSELGFLHDSNTLNDELPYWEMCATGKPIVMLPYGFDTNDMKYFNPNGFVRPDDFSVYVLAALETLLAEAGRGLSSMLTIGLHLRISGRPARFAAIEAILAHIAGLGDKVWVATRRDIAWHFATVVKPPV
jgi:peptidoglycan/xylan/chitin deacetylase (PgdA/CDA1 family)